MSSSTVPEKYRRVVSWLLASQRMRADRGLPCRCPPWVGVIGRHVHADFYARFTAVADEVGFNARSIEPAMGGGDESRCAARRPAAAADPRTAARRAGRTRHRDQRTLPGRQRTHVDHRGTVRREATLFHAGTLATPPSRRGIRPVPTTARRWAQVTPGLTETFLAYLDQLAVSLRASTVARAEIDPARVRRIHHRHDPAVTRVADLRRAHVEAYKLHLNQRPSITGGVLSKHSLVNHLGVLRVLLRATHRMGRRRPTGRSAGVLR